MSLLGDLFSKAKKFYVTTVHCVNCGAVTELRIPKGQTADYYIQSAQAVCPSCGCSTLKKFMMSGKSQMPEVKNPVKPRPIQEQSKPTTPVNQQYQTQAGTTLQLNPKQPKRINFWTGENE